MLLDWDSANWPECGKHGVSRDEIEQVFLGDPVVFGDPHHSGPEERFRAVGITAGGRYVFVAFTMRRGPSEIKIRPISARYMHNKEIRSYERDQSKKDAGAGER